MGAGSHPFLFKVKFFLLLPLLFPPSPLFHFPLRPSFSLFPSLLCSILSLEVGSLKIQQGVLRECCRLRHRVRVEPGCHRIRLHCHCALENRFLVEFLFFLWERKSEISPLKVKLTQGRIQKVKLGGATRAVGTRIEAPRAPRGWAPSPEIFGIFSLKVVHFDGF